MCWPTSGARAGITGSSPTILTGNSSWSQPSRSAPTQVRRSWNWGSAAIVEAVFAGAIVVSRLGVVTGNAFERLHGLLASSGAPVLGLIVNDAKLGNQGYESYYSPAAPGGSEPAAPTATRPTGPAASDLPAAPPRPTASSRR